jgi:mono/diheme cytochrome c family protein
VRKVLKWIGIGVGVLLVIVVLLAIVGIFRTNGMLTQKWEYTAETLTIPTDDESVARGQYLVEHFMLCQDCHGSNLGGEELVDDPSFATIYAPNLTRGQGGIGGTYTDADWIRTLRHGIRPNGENLIIMPSDFYTRVASDEIAEVIAYLKTIPPVDNEVPKRKLTLLPRVMLGLGIIPVTDLLPAHKIDHAAVTSPAPERAVTVEYGDYRVLTCRACHGEELAGMPADPQDPESLPTPNLTPGGELAAWSEGDFITTLQTGVTPGGHELDEFMPWEKIGKADVQDLQAIWLYLQTLPALPTNN